MGRITKLCQGLTEKHALFIGQRGIAKCADMICHVICQRRIIKSSYYRVVVSESTLMSITVALEQVSAFGDFNSKFIIFA